jgi:type IV secretory pathway VirB2 component (pilin)
MKAFDGRGNLSENHPNIRNGNTSWRTQMKYARLSMCSVLAVMMLTRQALAGPGGTGVERFGETALDFLSGTLGPIVLGLGIAIAAYGLIFGNRDGLQKAVWVIVGGVLLFSVDSVVGFIASASR